MTKDDDREAWRKERSGNQWPAENLLAKCKEDKDRYRAALVQIRNKVHSHNRGGEMYAGLRDVVRNICDEALMKTDDP